MKKVCLVSLGCAKNLVDSEMILAMFPLTSYTLSTSPKDADLIIVNTCGFIEAAKKEAKQMEKKAKLLSRNRKLNPNQA